MGRKIAFSSSIQQELRRVRRPFIEHAVTNGDRRSKEKPDESERHRAPDYTEENQDKRHIAAASSDQKWAEEAIEITYDYHPNRDEDNAAEIKGRRMSRQATARIATAAVPAQRSTVPPVCSPSFTRVLVAFNFAHVVREKSSPRLGRRGRKQVGRCRRYDLIARGRFPSIARFGLRTCMSFYGVGAYS